jgi:hypothetical protein
MATKSVQDKFANMATIICIESAANTLTYKKLETSFGTFEKIAWIIHRIEYFFTNASTAFNGTDDLLYCALMTGNTRNDLLTNTIFTDPQVLDLFAMTRWDFGAAGSGFTLTKPTIRDFSQMPSGGLIVPPSPLYGAVQGSGLAAAGSIVMRIYYTIKELATDEYWELVEARRLLTA